jgi:hypothetical protein
VKVLKSSFAIWTMTSLSWDSCQVEVIDHEDGVSLAVKSVEDAENPGHLG